jgi:hypothetical protein
MIGFLREIEAADSSDEQRHPAGPRSVHGPFLGTARPHERNSLAISLFHNPMQKASPRASVEEERVGRDTVQSGGAGLNVAFAVSLETRV